MYSQNQLWQRRLLELPEYKLLIYQVVGVEMTNGEVSSALLGSQSID